MSMSAEAKLAYGYQLGGGENDWHISEVDEDGAWSPSWMSSEDIADRKEDPADLLNFRLLEVVAGFTEEWSPGTGYYERLREAERVRGVEIISHGHHDFATYALVAHQIDADCGEPKQVALDTLLAKQEDLDRRLDAAVQALEITPTGPRGWLLIASYG